MVVPGEFAAFTRDDVGIVPYGAVPILLVGADAHICPAGNVAFLWNYRRIRNLYAGVQCTPLHSQKRHLKN